jgi:hypothetical protein
MLSYNLSYSIVKLDMTGEASEKNENNIHRKEHTGTKIIPCRRQQCFIKPYSFAQNSSIATPLSPPRPSTKQISRPAERPVRGILSPVSVPTPQPRPRSPHPRPGLVCAIPSARALGHGFSRLAPRGRRKRVLLAYCRCKAAYVFAARLS